MSPRYRVADTVAWVDAIDFGQGTDVYVMPVPDGDPVVLEGFGALIWTVAATGQDVVATVAEIAGQPPEVIGDDCATFLADLVTRGLLVEDDEPIPSASPADPKETRP